MLTPIWRRWRDLNSRAGRTDLPDFESGPFSRLGTSPYYKILKIADDLPPDFMCDFAAFFT